MFSDTASTRQPPAGGPGSPAHLDELLQELRRGDRDGFLRYFQLFRSPVYDFALRLLGDEAAAVTATTEAFLVAFRQSIVGDADTDLRLVTWRCALDACTTQSDAPESGRTRPEPASGHEMPRAHRLHRPRGSGRRFEEALEALDLRRRAALLLRDVHGLSVAETAAVFAISEEAAGTLLFRAREQFRRAFDERSTDLRGGSCRLAERAVAGAVGLGLGEDELRRLRRHASYCRPCRATMKTWGGGPVGLAALLEQAPLPRTLSTPVFRGAAESARVPAATGTSVLGRGLGRVGRALRSRTAAYVVAAACLALATGVAIREEGARQFILVQSSGPSIRLVTQPPADQPVREDGPVASVRQSSSGSQATLSLATSSRTFKAASVSAAQASSGSDAPAGSPGDGSTTTRDAGSPQVTAGSASPAAEGASVGRVAGKAMGKDRQRATKHKTPRARSQGRPRAAGAGHTKTTGHGRAKGAGHTRSARVKHAVHAGGGRVSKGRVSKSLGTSGKSKRSH